MKKQVILSITLVLVMLAVAIIPMTPVEGQTSPPEILGPGWYLGEADPVAPAEARRVLARPQVAAARAVAGLPASETEATVEIQALARALENDPKLIFDYVHNRIDYVPTFGSVNGATATLLAGRGNDWDQTSLFVALMRAAGYTANYVVADVTYPSDRLANWTGVPEASLFTLFAYGGVPVGYGQGGIQITRVFAQAEINGQTYIFDPAMKEYAETSGIDLDTIIGYDRTTFMTDAQQGATVTGDSVQNMNEANVQADLTTYSMNLVNYIKSHMPDATLAEVIGGREIVQAEMSSYSALPPYALDISNQQVYAEIPNTYRTTLRVQHEGIDHTFYTFQVAGKRVSIFYDAADNYKPVLRVDGETVATGTATSLGNWYDLTLSVNHPYAANGGTYCDQTGSHQLISGYEYVVVHDFDTASQELIASRNRMLSQYVQDGLAEDSEAVRGESLSLTALNYAHEEHLFLGLLGRISQGVLFRHHLVGVMAQEVGYYIDLPMMYTSVVSYGGASTQVTYRALSMMGSALEHGTWEQMQGSDREAVSTIKVLYLNNQNGDKTFRTNASNWSTVKPQLTNYWDLASIEAMINDGYTFVLPEDGAINLNQWHGEGYIAYTSSSSGMAMIIGGAYFGGSGSGIWDILSQLIQDLLNELWPELSKLLEQEIPKSGDPVDMGSGAFHLETQDLTAGPDGLLDLAFGRSYSSEASDALGPLGYGWSHNQQASLVFHHDYEAGLGRRQPTDAAALIVFVHVSLDVLASEDSIEGWMTADLVSKWAMDQLIDNAATAHFGPTTAEYVLLPDGSYNPPPGISWQLLKQGDYTYAQGPGNTCMIFDADGRGRVWTDANGNTLTYTYDGEDKLQSVGAPTLGLTLTFAYSGTLLTSVSDQAGRAVTFEYSGNDLTAFHDAEGNVTRYHYDTDHRLLSVTRPLSNTVVANDYDDLGRLITQTDALGNAITFYFSGYRNMEVYADGGRMAHYFNAQGRAIGNEDGQGNRVQMTYDGLGHLRTATDRLGDTTTYTYDPVSGQIATMTNPAGDTITHTYTSISYTCANPLNSDSVTLTAYNPARIDYADGSYETLAYDARGNLASHTDLQGYTTQYEHNARGQQTLITNPAGGQTTYTYNPDGTLASSTDSDTGVTTYTYDAYLRQNRITHPDGAFVQTTFDLNNRITSLTDERGQTTTYEYNANGNPIKVTDPLGGETTYAYNAMDQVTAVTNRLGKTTYYTYDERGRQASTTDPNGNTTQTQYDFHGWLTQITDPEGYSLQNQHNAEGLTTATTTPLGHTVTSQYDSQGRLLVSTDPLGNQTTLTRDALGRITASTDALGRTTGFTYDDRGLTSAVTLPGGETTAYAYNALGKLASVGDPAGHEWTFTYSPMGQLQRRTDPLGNQWQFTYNPRGFLTQVAYPAGEGLTLTYDAAGNLTRKQYSGGLDLNFSYDELNRLTAANGIGLTYNAEGQVIDTTDQATGIASGAAYDDGGRLVSVTYADGLFTVAYQYDARSLLTRVSDDLTGASVQFTYDDDGRLTGMTRSNGVNETLTWDAAARLTRIQDGTLLDLQYSYDAADQMIGQTYSQPLDPFDYLNGQVDNLSYDAASQISSSGYSYDARGRLLAGNSHLYTWDPASRLTGIDGVALSYNGQGDLLTRTANGQTTRYFCNHALGLTPITAEQDAASGDFRRFYVWTPGGALLYLIDAQNGNQVSFYHFDRSGSTLALTDETGTLTDAYAYDPFGRLLHHQGSNTQPFTYLGQWGARQEGESGTLYQMRARYYDTAAGRFLSREPLWPQVGDARAVNPYQYANQNPGNYMDVTGWGLTPAEYIRQRISQAGDVLDDEEAARIGEDSLRYCAEWLRQKMGDPAKYEPTVKQYGNWLVLSAGSVIDQEEADNITMELNRYATEWVRRNVGDPDKYELTPKQYLSWLMNNPRFGMVLDEEEMTEINQEFNEYTNEWVRRNIGDPEKYELTPEQYAGWLMRNAGEFIGEEEEDMITQELNRYAAEWNRRQSAQKTVKVLEPPATRLPRRHPKAHNVRQPLRLGGLYSVMP